MKESYVEGVANHTGSESCLDLPGKAKGHSSTGAERSSAHREQRTSMGFYLTEQATGTAAESRSAVRRSRTPRLPVLLRATNRQSGRPAPHRRGAKTRIGVPTGRSILSTKYLDKETGLYYYGYRFYNPSLGRWPSRDPIEERGGLTLYGFCANNAMARVDPNGLEWHVTWDITEGTWGFFERGHTKIDLWTFLYLVGPSPSCKGSGGCCKLDITDVKLLMTVQVPENASSATHLHELEHVFDFMTQLHNKGKTYLEGYSKCYKSCPIAECVVKALAGYALPMLQMNAAAYTIKNVDFPDSNFFTRPWYEEQYYSNLAGAREAERKLEGALRDCEE